MGLSLVNGRRGTCLVNYNVLSSTLVHWVPAWDCQETPSEMLPISLKFYQPYKRVKLWRKAFFSRHREINCILFMHSDLPLMSDIIFSFQLFLGSLFQLPWQLPRTPMLDKPYSL